MGIVAKQASRNMVSIILGTLFGAVNTILVLPRAFEGFEEGWGLIKVLTAYALIFAQLFHGGIPNAIIRFFPRLAEAEQGRFLRIVFTIPLIGSVLLGLIMAAAGPEVMQLVNANDAVLLEGNFGKLFALSTALIFFYALNGFVSAILKTTFFQFLNETFLKGWYLMIVLFYLGDKIEFDQLLLLYLGGYFTATIVLLLFSIRHGFRFERGPNPVDKKELTEYSAYSILDRGAGIIVSNLDIIMVGLLIGLDEVAFYTLAFYIGAVTMIPQKSIMAIANPLTSKAINNEDRADLMHIYRLSSLLQMVFGGLIFLCVWVSIDEIMVLLPEKFQGGKWVVFWIGLSKLFNMATGVSGGILVYSKYFKMNFRLNIVLIVLTGLTNYFLIHKSYGNLGIEGAALATAITFFVYNAMKLHYVKRYFGLTPVTRAYTMVILMTAAMSTLVFWEPMPDMPFAAIILKCVVICSVFLGAVFGLNLAPEMMNLLKQK